MSSTNTEAELASASRGFDHLFTNEITEAKDLFSSTTDSPFHLIGLGVCSFLEAALGMESMQMTEASKLLTQAEAASRKAAKDKSRSKTNGNGGRFPAGLEWEILNADAVVLLGITNALSESYMGYLQCLYALNNAHSKFTKLYKTVFPTGLDGYSTPSPGTPALTPKSSSSNLSVLSTSTAPSPALSKKPSFFGRWGGSSSSTPTTTSSAASSTLAVPQAGINVQQDGPIEDLIVAGTAFGFGLFNLVFSLLPKKIQSVVGFFGFKHSRSLALQALAVSAAKKDVHSVFAGLVLMTYHGVVLLLAGFQADEAHTVRQYRGVVDTIEPRYPNGSLWILNRAKILRMCYDPDGAIRVLQDGLKPGRHSFAQADTLLLFELAWTLLSQRRYAECAETFLKITTLNSWSHATYYFIAAGCHVSLALTSDSDERAKQFARAQELLDAIPGLMDKKKVGGKDLPTEVLIKKRIAFYQEKQKRRGGDEKKYAECIRISPAEELAIFWNTHARISPSIAEAHVRDWASLSPPVTISSPYIDSTLSTSSNSVPATPPDLDTPDELALRLLLLGIVHRTLGCAALVDKPTPKSNASEDVDAKPSESEPVVVTSTTDADPEKYTSPDTARAALAASRAFLTAAHASQSSIKVSTWVGGVAMFELAVLDLKEVEVAEKLEKGSGGNDSEDGNGTGNEDEKAGGIQPKDRERWGDVLKKAKGKLDAALALATNSTDLSSRLDSRIAMLRDEISIKAEAVGVDV